jgi:hypothetical protein
MHQNKKPRLLLMDISEYLKEPVGAAVFAAGVTAAYIYVKAKINNEGQPTTSAFAKPAVLVAILVYFIVSSGAGAREKISAEPF